MSFEDPAYLEDYIASLAPEEAESFLYDLGYLGANELPGALGGGYDFAAALSPQDYALTSGFGYGMPPELSKKGEVIPWGLDQETQALNIQQDRNALMADMVTAMMGGPGAWSAEAFQPTYQPLGQPIDTSPLRRARSYAGGGGYEGFLAQKMLEGATPSSAINQMWELVNQPESESVDPATAQMREELIASLPPSTRGGDEIDFAGMGINIPGATGEPDYTTPAGRAKSVDLKGITDYASKLFDEISSVPEAGYTDPASGLGFLGAQEVPSEATEWFTKRGLPLPTDTYMSPQYLGASGTPDTAYWDKQAQAQLGVETAMGREQAAQANEDAFTKAYREAESKTRPAQVSGVPGVMGSLRGSTRGGGTGPIARPAAEPITGSALDMPYVSYDPMTDDVRLALDEEVERMNRRQTDTREPFASRGELIITEPNFSRAITGGRDIRRGTERDVGRVRARTRGEQGRRRRAYAAADRARNEGPAGDTSVGRALAMQMQGRNPLQDAIAQRLLGLRAGGAYGG